MKIPPSHIALALLAFLVLCLPTRGSASIQLPSSLTDSDWSLRVYGTPTVEFTTVQGQNWLRIGRTAAGNGSGQYVYTGGSVNGSGIPVPSVENRLGDIRGSVIVGSSNWGDSLGVLLRAEGSAFNDTNPNGNAYYLAMTQSGLGLYWNVGAEFLTHAKVVRLAFNSYSSSPGTLSASSNNQYLLDFSAIGLQFEASVWAIDQNGQKIGDAIASISYLDERSEARTSGYFAVRGGRYGTDRSAYFRELDVQAIPEPATTALVFISLAGGALLRATRRTP